MSIYLYQMASTVLTMSISFAISAAELASASTGVSIRTENIGGDGFQPLSLPQALAGLRTMVSSAVKAEGKLEVWAPVFGTRQKAELVVASEKTFSVKLSGNIIEQSWDKITEEDLVSIAKSCIKADGSRALALSDYYMATGQRGKADDAITLALQLDAKLSANVLLRSRHIQAMATEKSTSLDTPMPLVSSKSNNGEHIGKTGNEGQPNIAVNVERFSDELSPYPVHPTSLTRSVDEIFTRTTGPKISAEYAQYRKAIIKMYKENGFDISVDRYEQRKFLPKTWSKQTPQPLSGDFKQPYSVDAPFYHKLAKDVGVELPAGYVDAFHIATVGKSADGWGIGIAISSDKDPLRKIYQTWDKDIPGKGDKAATMHVRANVWSFAPANTGDRHLCFIDGAAGTILHTWHVGKFGDDFTGYRAYGPYPLGTLGIGEGTNAAQMSDLVALLRSGEATDPNKPIPHALFGPGKRHWKAVVYPAVNWDEWVGKSDGGDGLVPYGGIVRLDPTLNLASMSLSLPALRILEAIQNYGWYYHDTGVREMDVWSNASGEELKGHVDAEVLKVLKSNKLFVVPPPVKR